MVEVYAEYDPETRGGNTPDGRKVRGTIHWVDAENALDATCNLYDNLFTEADPEADGRDFLDCINPDSLKIVEGCKAEKAIADFEAPAYFQFMRTGYFCIDPDSSKEKMIFNRSVSLKDGFKKK
ncbi:hypothetical protein [Ruminococcus sp.]|uniref:hypothetical protein n=1 Tax=Ruminococcus sp. TaxID=41978 RepID=UPI003864445A